MAFANTVKFTAGSSGTADFTPGTALTAFRALTVLTNGQAYSYRAVSLDGSQWENGNGVYSSAGGGSLARTTIHESSTGSKVNFSASPVVAITPLQADLDALSPIGKQSFYIPASAMAPRATSGAGEGTYDSGANDVTIRTMDFDTTTQEYAHFEMAMPKSWNEGTVTFAPYWTNTGGASTQTVVFSLAGRAVSNDDAINGSFGTAQTSSDTWLAQNDLHVGPESSAITIGGSPAEGDLVIFEVSRVVGSDNMAGDACLIGIMLFLTFDKGNDA